MSGTSEHDNQALLRTGVTLYRGPESGCGEDQNQSPVRNSLQGAQDSWPGEAESGCSEAKRQAIEDRVRPEKEQIQD